MYAAAGNRALRVRGRAQVERHGAIEQGLVGSDRFEVGQMPGRRGGVEIDRLGIDREGAPDVGAVVGIAHEHGRAARDLFASRGGQRGQKQPLAGAVERQHLARGVGGGGSAVAASRPGRDRRAQLLRAADRRIAAVVRHGLRELCRRQTPASPRAARRSVRSMGSACPGSMPSSRRRSCVNGDRIAPSASAANPDCEGMGVPARSFSAAALRERP